MAKLKQLKQHEEIFYPVTVGQAVIFEDDSTSAKVTDEEMDEIFDWDRNGIELVPIEIENSNFIEFTIDPSTINETVQS